MSNATTDRILDIAARHVANGAPAQSSAILCLDDARALAARDENLAAERRALDSLAHSVGVFHPDYVRAAELGGHYS
jgi:hypothetical protein